MYLSSKVGCLHRGLQGHLQLHILRVGSDLCCSVFCDKVIMLLLLALRHRLWLLLDWGLLRGLGRRAVAHLCSELLLGRGHLPLAAAAHHTSRLHAIRLRLGIVNISHRIVVGR